MTTKHYKYNLGGGITFSTVSGGGGGVIGGTIQSTQVAYGTGVDTIGGENDFVYDATNNLLTVEKTKTQVVVEIRNETGATINAGAVVYVAGSHSSGRPLVALADASDSAKMPSAFVVANQLPTGNNGYGILTGLLNGLNGAVGNTVFDQTLTVLDIGKTVYVSPTNAGRLTIDRPSGLTELVQNVGRITDFNGGNAKIAVNNIGRTNDVPNSIDAGQLTINSNYTFPSTDGSSGQVLVTDGLGSLTFQSPLADQVTASAIADESIAVGDLVRYIQTGEAGTIGRVKKAVATESNSDDVFVAITTATAGTSVGIVLSGGVPITFIAPPNSNDNGRRVYLDTNSGRATLTPPTSTGSLVVKLGTLTGADGSTNPTTVMFRPQFLMENG